MAGLSALIRPADGVIHLAHGVQSRSSGCRLIKRQINAAFGRYVATLLDRHCLFSHAVQRPDESCPRRPLGALISALAAFIPRLCHQSRYEIAAPQLGYSIIPQLAITLSRYDGGCQTFLRFLLAKPYRPAGLFRSVKGIPTKNQLCRGQYQKTSTPPMNLRSGSETPSSGQLTKTPTYYDSETGRFYVAANPVRLNCRKSILVLSLTVCRLSRSKMSMNGINTARSSTMKAAAVRHGKRQDC